MYISARERVILEILLSNDGDITIKSLSDELDVSERTIHRDLKGVEQILSVNDLELVKKSGVGIRVVGDKAKIEELNLTLYNQPHNEFTPEERQTVILCNLLESVEPIKLISLANDLNVTIVTVSNDLTKLESRLSSYDLSLVRRRGYGVELIGEESAKRKAMSDIIAQNLDEVDFLTLVRRNIKNRASKQTDTISEKLLGLVEKEKLIIVEKIIGEINSELDYHIADSAYIGLVVHLSLAIERIVQGENITMDPAFLETLKVTSEYKIAEKIIEKLQRVFQIDIPSAEIGYITMHLQGAKLRFENEYRIESSHFQAADKAKKLIRAVSDELGVDLTNDYSLFQGLVVHLTPALYRVQQRMGIHNPLLEKIKSDYADLFTVVQQGVEQVFPEWTIPDEEVGFIVLHFGSALLGIKIKDEYNALVICSTGIGTSKILSTRIKQEIPEIKSIENASLFELKQIDVSEYDLIISTIQLNDFSSDYILVSPILNQEEVGRIKDAMKGKSKKHKAKQDLYVNNNGNYKRVLNKFHNIEQLTSTMQSILKGFRLELLEDQPNIEKDLFKACQLVHKVGKISQVEGVVSALLEREKQGGLAIPSSRLALFHTRSSYVLEPVFTMNILPKPREIRAMDQSLVPIDHVILMLAPENAEKQDLEILSYLSSIIIEDEKSLALFQSQDESQIKSFLAYKLEQFYFEKTQEMRNE